MASVAPGPECAPCALVLPSKMDMKEGTELGRGLRLGKMLGAGVQVGGRAAWQRRPGGLCLTPWHALAAVPPPPPPPTAPPQARVFELVDKDGRPTDRVIKVNHRGACGGASRRRRRVG